MSMQGTHMFRRDRMCQVIKCNPWSTRLYPNPTIVKKMKTYLELEGKLGPKPQPQSNQLDLPNLIPTPIRKETKATEKRKRVIPTKKYKSESCGQTEFQQCNHATTSNSS